MSGTAGSRLAAWARSVPPGPARGLSAISFVDALGSGAFLTASVTIYVDQLDVSATQVGIALSIAGGASIGSGVWLGRLADRIGPRRLLLLLNGTLALLFCLLPAVRGFWPFLVAITAILMTQSGVVPARSALTFHVLDPDSRVRLQAVQRSLFNLGFAAGAAVAVIALEWGGSRGFIVLIGCNVMSYLVGALLVWRIPDRRGTTRQEPRTRAVRQALRDRAFVRFVALSVVLMLSESIFYIGFPLWIVSVADAPRGLAAGVFLINTIMVVVLQVPASRGTERPGGAVRLIRYAFAALAAAALTMALGADLRGVDAIAPIVLAAVLVTLAELWSSAVGWSVLFTYPPAELQGTYQGVFAMGSSLQVVLGPVLVGALLIQSGGLGWLGFAAIAVISVPVASLVVRSVTRDPSPDASAPNP